MSAVALNRVLDRLDLALGLLGRDDGTCLLDPLPCRTAIYLGGEVPWDECSTNSGCGGGKNGMLWAKLIGLDPTASGSDQGSCATYTWTAEFGVVRCITGSEGVAPPSAAAITADARQQADDADAIYNALRCCLTRPEALAEVALTSWRPLGPSGGCAGGAWTVRGRLDVCC